MGRRSRQWKEMFDSLGQALVDLWAAEVGALGRDFGKSGRTLGQAAALMGAAAAVAFWLVAAVVFVAVAALHEAAGLPWWGSAALVAAGLALAAALLGFLGWRRIERVETPGAIFRRHMEDHVAWWRRLRGGEAAPAEPALDVGHDTVEEDL